MFVDRVLSGMRPTGRMHIGHYHGALKNWLRLQEEYECLYFAADWHALTTNFDSSEIIADSVWEMMIDWLAVYDRTSDRCYYIRADLLGDGMNSVSLRLAPARNRQRKGVRLAADHLELEVPSS